MKQSGNGKSPNNPVIGEEDIELFRSTIGDVTRIEQNRADLGRPRKKQDTSIAARRQAATTETEQTIIDGLSNGHIPEVKPSDPLHFALDSLPYRTLQQLKKGQIRWQEGLDLHGYTIEDARNELYNFIQDSKHQGYRCVIVVHGKAYSGLSRTPIIKAHVNAWLRQMPEVLAFTSALPADGGTGAVYVLLRTKQ